MELDKRFFETEIRALTEKDEKIVEGYAIRFNKESRNLGGFVEVIKPTAIDMDLINRSDIKLVFNHNQSIGILARSKNGEGTLKINIDGDGVYFKAKLPNTQLGNDVYESISRGDLDGCSFRFGNRSENNSWEKRSDGVYLKTINKIDIIDDFSIVVNPVYEDAKLSKRSEDEFNSVKEKLDVDKEKETELKKKKEYDKYINKLKEKYLKNMQ